MCRNDQKSPLNAFKKRASCNKRAVSPRQRHFRVTHNPWVAGSSPARPTSGLPLVHETSPQVRGVLSSGGTARDSAATSCEALGRVHIANTKPRRAGFLTDQIHRRNRIVAAAPNSPCALADGQAKDPTGGVVTPGPARSAERPGRLRMDRMSYHHRSPADWGTEQVWVSRP